MDLLASDLHMCEADGEGEAARAGAAGIDVKNTSVLFNGGLVGMAAHYYAEACAGWADVDLFDVVQYVD